RAVDGEHDAGGHLEGARGPRRGERDPSGRRWRLRGGAGPVRQSRRQRGPARGAASGRRREVVRELLARADGGDRVEECRAQQGGLGAMNVLAIDIGGTHVKILAMGQHEPRKVVSGPKLGPDAMVAGVKKLAKGWKYDVVSIGYPGPVLHGGPVGEPHNLAKGWVGFDYEGAFECPVKIVNDAAMQALGSYEGGKMLFLGLGTGLGTAMIVDGMLEPLELGHLPYKKGTYEDYVGLRGLEKGGKKKWRKHVTDVVERRVAGLQPEHHGLRGGHG